MDSSAAAPPPLDDPRHAKHVSGQRWPVCPCRLCMDEHICPAAVVRTGRALVLVTAAGLVAAAVASL